MGLKDIIIGLCALGVVLSVILSFTFDLYKPSNLNINLSDNVDTKVLIGLQEQNNLAEAQNQETTLKLYNKTVGQEGADISSGSITDADMIKTSWSALTNIGSYLDVFVNMLSHMFIAVGLGTENPIFTFIIFSLVISIAVYMISSVFPGWGN